MSSALIIVVDDDRAIAELVARWLKSAGHRAMVATSGDAAQQLFLSTIADLAIVDLDLGDMTGLQLMRWMREVRSPCPFVMMTASAEVADVVAAMREGALEYLVKPVNRGHLLRVVQQALDVGRERDAGQQPRTDASIARHGIVGNSTSIRRVHEQINRLAQSDVTVLIGGETGTGKEIVARAIHSASRRSDGPFVAVNCGAIPEGLRESEFFGHERGAFTGAVGQREGAFERANGGVIFLDEVGDLPPPMQVMLLRVLQERSFRRVGGTREIETDVRVLAASHHKLSQLVERGQFRSDLYYRLAVYEFSLPPLRVRGDDVLLIARHFLGQLAGRGATPLELSEAAEQVLLAYDWPGNVRELRNAMEHASVAADHRILPEHLPPRLTSSPTTRTASRAVVTQGEVDEEREREMIMAAIAAADGNVSQAIRTLGIPRTTMYRKMHKYGIIRGKDGG